MELPTDAMTRSSADDALAGKFAACKLGYLSDPFVATMLAKSHGAVSKSMRKRQPIINRGYYARVETIRVRLTEFMKSQGEGHVQVINLGCGFDTLSLELLDQCNVSGRDMSIFEVDFTEVVRQKAEYILQEPKLNAPLNRNEKSAPPAGTGAGAGAGAGSVAGSMPPPACSSSRPGPARTSWTGASICLDSSNRLHLLGCDLRNAVEVTSALLASRIDPKVPTAIISECTLVYMESSHAASLCSALGDLLDAATPAVWISYDMTHSEDTYGKVMLRNLSQAGYAVPSFTQLPTLAAHQKLFAESGWGDPAARVQAEASGGGTGIVKKKNNFFDSVFKRRAADSLVSKTVTEVGNEEDDEKEEENECKEGQQPSSGSVNIDLDVSVAMDEEEHAKATGAPATSASNGAAARHGFGKVESITMLQAWDELVSPAEKARVAKLEIFDEVEEWYMLMSHYVLTTACRNVHLESS